MTFIRDNLPDTRAYFENEGLELKGPGKWLTTACTFHGGSDSMRINTESGGWVCMACGIKGGDVLAYPLRWQILCSTKPTARKQAMTATAAYFKKGTP